MKKIKINNSELLEEVIKSNKTQITVKLCKILQDLIRLTKAKYFTYKDQYVSEEVERDSLCKCLEKCSTFDTDRSKNAHAFFTTIVINELKASFKRNSYIMKKNVKIVSLNDVDI